VSGQTNSIVSVAVKVILMALEGVQNNYLSYPTGSIMRLDIIVMDILMDFVNCYLDLLTSSEESLDAIGFHLIPIICCTNISPPNAPPGL